MPNDNKQTSSATTNGDNNQPTVQPNMQSIPSSFQSGTPSAQTDTQLPQQTASQTQSSGNVQTNPESFPPDVSDTLIPTGTVTQNMDSGRNQSPNMKDIGSIITSEHVPERLGGKKVIATIFGILFLVGGVVAGVFLSQKRQFLPSYAWNCSLYVFDVSQQGEVAVMNGQTRNEPGQKAQVFINTVLQTTLDVPALKAGGAATLGNVSVPSGQGFSWRVHGTVDCENSGNYGPTVTSTPTPTQIPTSTPTPTVSPSPTPTFVPTSTPTPPLIGAACLDVQAFDVNWNPLGAVELSNSQVGDVVRFAVGGTTTSGTFDKARFTVNGIGLGETTNKKPGTDEFYSEYTVPEGIVNFTVSAQLHHSELGWF